MSTINGNRYTFHVFDNHMVGVCTVKGAHPVTAMTTLRSVMKPFTNVERTRRDSDFPHPTVTVYFTKDTDGFALAGAITAMLNELPISSFVHTCTAEMIDKSLAVSNVPFGHD